MTEIDLSRLFDGDVTVSASEITPLSVSALSELKADERPAGYDTWGEKRKREFRAGRHHARLALSSAGGPERAILRDEDGVPVFPEGYHGSITHTGRVTTYAAAAISRSPSRVGIDAEEIRDLPHDMVNYILTASERERLYETNLETTPRLSAEGHLALLAFSAKEAFYKCIFPDVRCRLGFHDVEFRLGQLETHHGRTPGSFELLLHVPPTAIAPRALEGRYLTDERRVICGVQWSRRIMD